MQGIVLFVIIGAIICCIAGFFCPKFEYLNADNIVITFLGILATFVVISNFSQVADIRDRTEKELDWMKKQMDVKEIEYNEKIDKTQKQIDLTGKELIELKPLFDALIRKEVASILDGINGCSRFGILEYSFIEKRIAYGESRGLQTRAKRRHRQKLLCQYQRKGTENLYCGYCQENLQ